jgi:TatD DNase family protein
MAYSLIDTHCHLDIIQEQGQEIPVSLEISKAVGVKKIVQIGIDLPSSFRAKQISEDFSTEELKIHYTVGCHPTETHEFPKAKEILSLAAECLEDPSFTGIGEIGMDLYHNADKKSEQREILSQFLAFSAQEHLPVVIHSRDAFQDTYEGLQEFKGKAFGVIHCFTYDYEIGKKFVDLGFYISFSGILAFKNATDIHNAAKKLPLESILIETDAPFLAPPPHRGKRNDSSNMPYILERMFTLREETNSKIEETLFLNSEKFLNRKAYYA